MAREFIKLYVDYIESIKLLSDAECGRLFVALLEYGKSGAEQKLSGNERFVYALIKTQLDIDKSQNRGGAPKGNQNAKKQPVDLENNINQLKQPVDLENNSKQPVDFREKEKTPPFVPPSSFPPGPPNSSPPYNPPKKEKEGATDSAEPENQAHTPAAGIFINFPLNDKTEYGVTETRVREYAELYPAVDVKQELREIKAWCIANPTKRKTRGGAEKFINNWLSREQDRGANNRAGPPANEHKSASQILAEAKERGKI